MRMKKLTAVFLPLILLFFIPTLFAGTPATENQLKLIPEPKEVRVHQGRFRVRPTTRILVEFGHQDEDRIAAETLVDEIHDQSGLKLSITGSKEKARQVRSTIVLARLQDRSVREFLEAKGLKADSIGDQGYL